MKQIDLNADLGEGMPFDAQLMAIISSASIACGGHAGDDLSMRNAISRARGHGVRVGAHPGYADRKNFGRVVLELPDLTVADQVERQVERLLTIATQQSAEVKYVKLHGALYNKASCLFDFSCILFERVKKLGRNLAVMAMDDSQQVKAAQHLGMGYISEAFADRLYEPDGKLVARGEPGAVVDDKRKALEQVRRIVQGRELFARDGSAIPSKAASICLHGDNEKALTLARTIAEGLRSDSVEICATPACQG